MDRLLQRFERLLQRERLPKEQVERIVDKLKPKQPRPKPARPVPRVDGGPAFNFVLSEDLNLYGGALRKFVLRVNPSLPAVRLPVLLKKLADFYPRILEWVHGLNPYSTSVVFDFLVLQEQQKKGGVNTREFTFHLPPFRLDRQPIFFAIQQELEKKFAELKNNPDSGSGWVVKDLLAVDIIITNKRAPSGKSYIPSPSFLRALPQVFNVRNNDLMCFRYAIAAIKVSERPIYTTPDNLWLSTLPELKETRQLHLESITDPEVLKQTPEFLEIKDSMLTYPIRLNDSETDSALQKFEEVNQCRVRIIGLHETASGVFERSIIRRPSIPLPSALQTLNLIVIQEEYRDTTNPETFFVNTHFVGIGSDGFSSLMRCDRQKKPFICDCGALFSSEKAFNNHLLSRICLGEKHPTLFTFPVEEWQATTKFKNFSRTMPASFNIYADIETIQTPCQVSRAGITALHEFDSIALLGLARNPDLNLPLISYEHKGDGPRTGKPIIEGVVEMVKQWAERVEAKAMQPLTLEEEEKYQDAKIGKGVCFLCGKVFKKHQHRKKRSQSGQGDVSEAEGVDAKCPVRHYDHQTGKFIGLAHSKCNLRVHFDQERAVYVWFHNGSGYDFHPIITALGSCDCIQNVSPLFRTNERSIQIEFRLKAPNHPADNWRVVIRDTLRHYGPGSSLKKLTEALKSGGGIDAFPHTVSYHLAKGRSKEMIEKHLLQKGLMCHDWLNVNGTDLRWPHRPHTRQERLEGGWPGFEAFESVLLREASTEETFDPQGWARLRHEEAKAVYDALECKSFGEYLEAYSVNDVLLLADCFEFHRKTLYNLSIPGKDGQPIPFHLDPAHYVGIPALSKDIMLKCTGIKLKTFSEEDAQAGMLDMIEPAIRGGNSFISLRKFEIDSLKQAAMDLDANSLYPSAMIHALPIDSFELMDDVQTLQHFLANNCAEILKLSDDVETGYDFEFDFYIPRELHETFNSYPILPYRGAVGEEMLSEKFKDLDAKTDQALHRRVAEECERKAVLNPAQAALYLEQATRARERAKHYIYIPSMKRETKLISSLEPQTHYVAHWSLVQEALKRGYVITKIHRVLKYRQSAFLKSLIEGMALMRSKAGSKLEKDMYKLIMNSLYGKFLENARNYSVNKLVTDTETFRRLAANPLYKEKFQVFGPDVTMLEFGKGEQVFRQCILVGQAILDISKAIMSSFYYGVLKPIFKEKVEVALTDTDSLLCLFTDARMVTVSNDELRTQYLEQFNVEVEAELKQRTAKSEALTLKKGEEALKKLAKMPSVTELDRLYIDEARYKYEALMNKLEVEKEALRLWFAIRKMFPETDSNGKTLADYLDLLDSKKLGLFKPDNGVENEITGFIGLRPKVYYMRQRKRNLFTRKDRETAVIRAKGIDKVASNDLTWEMYSRALVGDVIMAEMDRIISINHQIYSARVRKIALSGNDDKRYILPDGIHTLAYGYGRPDPKPEVDEDYIANI